MMTEVYFVRHCEADNSIQDEMKRPLTQQGEKDCYRVTYYLMTKDIGFIASSPYKRTYDTLFDFSRRRHMAIMCMRQLCERKVADEWLDDFHSFAQRQWQDFNYKLPSGESLAEVQQRNISALSYILSNHADKNIAIGTHGTALSTIINFFDPSFGFEKYMEIADMMPLVAHFTFDGFECKNIEYVPFN